MREATVRVFQQYRREREEIVNNNRLSLAQYYAARINALARLEVRGTDAELGQFFTLLQTGMNAELGYARQAEAEAKRLDLIRSVGEIFTPEADNPVVALGLAWAQARFDNADFVAFKTRWIPTFAAARETHEAGEERLLSNLTRRYGYPFYETVYAFDQPASLEGRDTAQPVGCQGFRATTQITVAQAAQTNFTVCAGDRVSITVGGFMQVGHFAGFSGPDGLDNQFLQPYNLVPEFPHAALLVKFQPQSNRAWTYVGYEQDLLAPVSGPLQFLVNDGKTDDNRGGYTVQITVRPANF